VHATPIKQRLISALAAVARESDVAIISEGVENEHECLALGVLGCDVVQGYHIARPARDLTSPFELRVVPAPKVTVPTRQGGASQVDAVTGTRPKFSAGWSDPSQSETGT
jgi:EAL domain-containing protein (putative c-di-GMP-specific phosphodiesterase class I)